MQHTCSTITWCTIMWLLVINHVANVMKLHVVMWLSEGGAHVCVCSHVIMGCVCVCSHVTSCVWFPSGSRRRWRTCSPSRKRQPKRISPNQLIPWGTHVRLSLWVRGIRCSFLLNSAWSNFWEIQACYTVVDVSSIVSPLVPLIPVKCDANVFRRMSFACVVKANVFAVL